MEAHQCIPPGWELLCASLEEGVLVIDGQRRIKFFNRALADLCGAPLADWVGRPLKESSGLNWLSEPFEAFRKDQVLHATQRLEVSSDSHRPVVIEAQFFVVSGEPNADSIILIKDDARRKLAEAVFRLQKPQALAAAALGIAHDFNNSLTGVISHLDLAITEPDLPEAIKGYLNFARSSARRGCDLAAKLQWLKQMTASGGSDQAFVQLVEQAVYLMQKAFGPGVTIVLEKPPADLWAPRADHEDLLLVLLNVCTNCRSTLPERGEIRLRLQNRSFGPNGPHAVGGGEHVRELVEIDIEHNGGRWPEPSGNAANLQNYLRLARKEVGFGLWLSCELIAEQGGSVEVQPGHDAKLVRILLPRAEPNEASQTQSDQIAIRSSPERPQKARILIVDDEEMVRTVMRAILAFRGYEVSEAADGEEAIRYCRDVAHGFDVILMDMHMPGLSGREAIECIRRENPKAKFILLSGSLPEKGVERSPEPGSVAFLNKPFENQQLIETVQQVITAAGSRL